jgi:hypothetical protein
VAEFVKMFATPNWIVEAFNVLKDLRLGLMPCFVNTLFDFFTLQVTEELFGHCVVPAVASSAHTGDQSAFLAPAAELVTSKLRALVRVDDHRALSTAGRGQVRFCSFLIYTNCPLP